MNDRSTLLVFSLAPAVEARRRKLVPEQHRYLAQAALGNCLEQALEAGRSLGCRLELAGSEDVPRAEDVVLRTQVGGTFGERLSTALEQAFAAQSGSVVVVGSDAPDLSKRHLASALAHLEADPDAVVVGPSADGGVYLLAARRPFDEAVEKTKWCQRGTRKSLECALRAANRRVIRLDRLVDLDTRADLESWISKVSCQLTEALRRALAPVRCWRRTDRDVVELFCYRLLRERAPPVTVGCETVYCVS